jgi:peptidoglycan hydrolase CwlO-like protein
MGFRDRVQDAINQGLKSSRELFDKAKSKAKDLGEKGVLRIEISQLDNQIEKLFAKLGSSVYRVLVEEEHNTVSRSTPEVKELLDDISDVRGRIEEKEQELKDFDATES